MSDTAIKVYYHEGHEVYCFFFVFFVPFVVNKILNINYTNDA